MVKIERVTVTKDDLKNGWDDASLAEYLASRTEAQAEKINPRSESRRVKPIEQNHFYRPLRWRE